MENALKIFEHPEFGTVRTITDEHEEHWFVAKDICNVLTIGNPADAVSSLDDDEKADIDITDISSNGVKQNRNFSIINESGLYSLILRSRKPEAKRFKKWVTSEVLPQIRQTGVYTKAMTPGEILLMHAQRFLENERKTMAAYKLAEDAVRRLDNIETAHDHFTVLGYCALNGKKISLESAKRYGKQATKLCREMNVEMGSVPDPRFGRANTYPMFVLRDIVEM